MWAVQVMLEITGQIELTPFVAVSAIVGDVAASSVTGHGLYHALIEAAGLPYLPLERPPEFDEDAHHALGRTTAPSGGSAGAYASALGGGGVSWRRRMHALHQWLCGHGLRPFLLRPWTSRLRMDAVLVRDVMTPAPLQTVRYDETRLGVLRRLGEPPAHQVRGAPRPRHCCAPCVQALATALNEARHCAPVRACKRSPRRPPLVPSPAHRACP